jgi:hypothetical protein
MRDRCRITGPATGEKVWSDELLAYVDAPPPVIYEGKCKLTFGAVVPNERTTADQRFAEQGGTLALPVVTPADALGDTAAVARGHKVVVLASVTDAGMVGDVFTVGAKRPRSAPTSRRFQLEDSQ